MMTSWHLNKLRDAQREAGDLRRYRGHYDVIVMDLIDFLDRYIDSMNSR